MADFAVWASAWEAEPGAFMKAYRENIAGGVMSVIEADSVSSAVKAFMATRPEWTGTATGLLSELEHIAGDRTVRSKMWPGSPQALSNRLRRGATFLRKAGIHIQFDRTNKEKLITVSRVPPGEDRKVGKFASLASPPSPMAETLDFLGDANSGSNGGGKDICVASPSGEAGAVATVTASVTDDVLKIKEMTKVTQVTQK